MVDVGDEDLAVVCGLDPDLGDVAVVEPLLGVRGVGAEKGVLRKYLLMMSYVSESVPSPRGLIQSNLQDLQ